MAARHETSARSSACHIANWQQGRCASKTPPRSPSSEDLPAQYNAVLQKRRQQASQLHPSPTQACLYDPIAHTKKLSRCGNTPVPKFAQHKYLPIHIGETLHGLVKRLEEHTSELQSH